jgi:hypothetical protein
MRLHKREIDEVSELDGWLGFEPVSKKRMIRSIWLM